MWIHASIVLWRSIRLTIRWPGHWISLSNWFATYKFISGITPLVLDTHAITTRPSIARCLVVTPPRHAQIVCSRLGIAIEYEQAKEMFYGYDSNGDGCLSFYEFIQNVMPKGTSSLHYNAISHIFCANIRMPCRCDIITHFYSINLTLRRLPCQELEQSP